MKKILAILLLVVTLFSFASCGKEWKYVTELPTYATEAKILVVYHNIKDIQEVGEHKVYVKGYSSEEPSTENCLFECIGSLTVSVREQKWCASILYTDHLGWSRSIGLDSDDWTIKKNK